MAVIGITYEEPTPSKYEFVDISYGKGMKEKKEFKSGNFVKDWYDMRKFMIQNLLDSEHAFCHSSSVDHFIMDGAPYDSAYLLRDEEKEDNYLYYGRVREVQEGVEFFVAKGTQPNWDELKEICK